MSFRGAPASVLVVFSPSFSGHRSASDERQLWFGGTLLNHRKQADCQGKVSLQSPLRQECCIPTAGQHGAVTQGCGRHGVHHHKKPCLALQRALQHVTLWQSTCF